MKKYFVHTDDGIEEYCETLEEAIKNLEERIQDHSDMDCGWPDEEYMGRFFVGEATHVATKTNVEKRPPKEELDEEMCDKNGVHWDHEFEETYDYEVQPVVIEALKKALEEGNVRTFQSDAPEDILYDDCDNTISLIRDVGIDGAFGISVADGGGFTGVLFAPAQWREMNAKIEAFMKEKGW